MFITLLAIQGKESFASWKGLPDDELIPHYFNPDNIIIVVAGGETSSLRKTTDYWYKISVAINRRRPERVQSECSDGTCGLPDEQDDYD